MKKALYLILVIAAFVSCGRKHKSKPAVSKQDRIEIIPFYKNVVLTQDLHLLDTNLILVEPEEFLSGEQYKKFTDALWTIINDERPGIFPGSMPNYFGKNKKERRERFVRCDSVVQVDENDQPIGKPFWSCDSTYWMGSMSRVVFYEAWYLNTKTNLIEKETLGYSVWNYVKEKEAFKEMLIVFRDEEAAKKCELYEFSE
jgi:hypothetical protein